MLMILYNLLIAMIIDKRCRLTSDTVKKDQS